MPASDAKGLDALADELQRRPDAIDELLRQHSGVLLRGFCVDDAAAFQRCAELLGATPDGYVGGNSPRAHVGGDVFTSTEFPAAETITLHQEMSYLPRPPARLFFHCRIPATLGGRTPLGLAGEILRAMPDSVLRAFENRRLRYIRHFEPTGRLGKTWQQTWATEHRDTVVRAIAAQGSTAIWRADGGLRVETVCNAFTTHPRTGQPLWFNQAEQWHASALPVATRAVLESAFGAGGLAHHCEFEDGTPLDEDVLAQVRAVLHAQRLLFDWQRGDVLMIDNFALMHGREPFRGSRKILVLISGQ